MPLNWLESRLHKLANTSVIYITDEGSEIPLESGDELEEVVRLAMLNGKNQVQFALKFDYLKSNEVIPVDETINIVSTSNKNDQAKDDLSHVNSLFHKEKHCQCNEEVPPLWFTHYMKKFKKALLQELKSSTQEKSCNPCEKEKKPLETQLDKFDEYFFQHKSFASVTEPPKKKKTKFSEKESSDQVMEQREAKLMKKMEKLHLTKFERLESRLEKLDNKTKMLLEERKKKMERKLCSKSRPDKKGVEPTDKVKPAMHDPSIDKDGQMKRERSAVFLDKEIKMWLRPGTEFYLTTSVKNNGTSPWRFAYVEIFNIHGFIFSETSFEAPNLKPGEMGLVNLNGKVTNRLGESHFFCKCRDNFGELGPSIICSAEVSYVADPNKPLCTSREFSGVLCKSIGDTKSHSEEEDSRRDFREPLQNFDENYLIASSQKKIEENIIEIQKRLRDIHLLGSPFERDVINLKDNYKLHLKCKLKPGKKITSSDFQIKDFDLLQNLEKKKESKEKDSARKSFCENSPECERTVGEEQMNGSPPNDGPDPCVRGQLENLQNLPKNAEDKNDVDSEKSESLEELKEELESDSSSIVNVIFDSEDDNFIVVPMPSKTPTPEVNLFEEEKLVSESSVNEPSVSISTKEPSVSEIKEEPPKEDPKVEIKVEIIGNVRKGEEMEKRNPPSLATKCDEGVFVNATRSRRSPFGEGRTESKTKKMKSARVTEYQFTSETLAQPTFSCYLDKKTGSAEHFNSAFTFTAKNGNSFKHEGKGDIPTKEEGTRMNKVPITDSSGEVIYAVKRNGSCVPVGSLLQDNMWKEDRSSTFQQNSGDNRKGWGSRQNERAEMTRNGMQMNQNRFERSNECFNVVPPAVNILPDVFMHGASSMASLALNTAKSVINNIQSAFVADGNTEMDKPSRVSMKAMFKLYDMGFTDLQMNQKLLLIHDNDISKVVEELVLLQNRRSSTQQ